MSLIAAVKTEGRVLMGADTQVSSGKNSKYNLRHTDNLKIKRFPHGILVGMAGLVSAAQMLAVHSDWFDTLGQEPLSKEFLVRNIIPRFCSELTEAGLLNKETPFPSFDGTYLLAQGDRLFRIDRDFSVTVIPAYCAVGSGSDAAYAVHVCRPDADARTGLLEGLRQAHRTVSGVSAPYVLIDTEHLEFEWVEE